MKGRIELLNGPTVRTAVIVFVSATALGDRVNDVLRDILDRGRAKVAVATDGERGSRLAVRDQPIRHVPAVTLADRPVVDSNGAGDSYVAAFLATVLGGGTYEDATLAGSIAGRVHCVDGQRVARAVGQWRLRRPDLRAVVRGGRRLVSHGARHGGTGAVGDGHPGQLSVGHLTPMTLVHVGYFVGMTAVGLWLTTVRLRALFLR